MSDSAKTMPTAEVASLREAASRINRNVAAMEQIADILRGAGEEALAARVLEKGIPFLPSKMKSQSAHDVYDEYSDRKIKYDKLRSEGVLKAVAVRECFEGVPLNDVKRILDGTWRQVRELVAEKKKKMREISEISDDPSF